MIRHRHCLFAAVVLILGCAHRGAEIVGLQSLDLGKMTQGEGRPQANRSVRGKKLSLGGRTFQRGVGTHAESALWVQLDRGSVRFQAVVGLDDKAGGSGSARFEILADGLPLWSSGVMKPGDGAKPVDVDVRGVELLLLHVSDGGDGDRFDDADWADAKFIVAGAKPRAVAAPREEPVILTPKPGAAPRINGPKVYGCRPGNPFLYRIPCQGERPMRFAADLPASLRLDPATGIITGTDPPPGEYVVTLHAANRHGKSERGFRISSGGKLALTPPMGWNPWYVHYTRITDPIVRQAANAMIASGMADVGYQYVSIDDCWMRAPATDKYQTDPQRVGVVRDAGGNILPNRFFPDMPALTAYIHANGLKAGIYSSPGPKTCDGFAGSYQHEAQDAKQFADWGFDLLKYDWCSYGHIALGGGPDDKDIKLWGETTDSLALLQHPYQLMGGLLQRQSRDMVFNLCQYGMGNVWEWGEEVGGQSWRTAGDLGFELGRIFEVALENTKHRAWSRPGAWNDPDYIQIGNIGDVRTKGPPKPCPLTPNEQYAFMSLWCLMAAPLFYSGDMGTLDAFTLNVLCNPEVIDVDQDEIGQGAALAPISETTFLLVKDLADGSKAVGLFNRGEVEAEVSASWAMVGVSGKQTVRDLWRQTDLGTFAGAFQAIVPRHGVKLVKISPARQRRAEAQ